MTSAATSAVMRANRGDVPLAPEMRVRWAIRKARMSGARYNLKTLPGKPDVAWPELRVALFVDGCYWHRCPAHRGRPKTNSEFWEAKFRRNRQRDRAVDRVLSRRRGYMVVRVWECTVKRDLGKLMDALDMALQCGHEGVHRLGPTLRKREKVWVC